MTFGEYFRRARLESGQTLRSFCREHGFDPGNVSKLERGKISAPRSRDRILQYATSLSIPHSEWQTFCDLAAISGGRIPGDLIYKDSHSEIDLSLLFSVIRAAKFDGRKLEQIAKLIQSG